MRKEEEPFLVELRARRRKPGEELPSLRADITTFVAVAHTGDVSPMGHMVAMDNFLTELGDMEKCEMLLEATTRDRTAVTRCNVAEMVGKWTNVFILDNVGTETCRCCNWWSDRYRRYRSQSTQILTGKVKRTLADGAGMCDGANNVQSVLQ